MFIPGSPSRTGFPAGPISAQARDVQQLLDSSYFTSRTVQDDLVFTSRRTVETFGTRTVMSLVAARMVMMMMAGSG